MQCPKCGKEMLPEGVCPECGIAPSQPSEIGRHYTLIPARYRSFVTWLLFLIAVLLVFAVIICANTYHEYPPRKWKEETLRDNIKRLRDAIDQFHTDSGVYPARLQDIVAPSDSTPEGTKPGKYKGPYLTPNGGVQNTGVPVNPFVDYNKPLAAHWTYNPKNGTVRSAVQGRTLDGKPYSAL